MRLEVIVALASVLMAAIIAMTGWQIGKSVTNDVTAIRSSVTSSMSAMKDDVKAIRVDIKELTSSVSKNTYDRLRKDQALRDHETRLRRLERGQ